MVITNHHHYLTERDWSEWSGGDTSSSSFPPTEVYEVYGDEKIFSSTQVRNIITNVLGGTLFIYSNLVRKRRLQGICNFPYRFS